MDLPLRSFACMECIGCLRFAKLDQSYCEHNLFTHSWINARCCIVIVVLLLEDLIRVVMIYFASEDPGSMFFELLAVEDPSKPAIPAWEAEVGSRYALVVTTYGGLCRCQLGDIVRVHAMYGKMPIVSVELRAN